MSSFNIRVAAKVVIIFDIVNGIPLFVKNLTHLLVLNKDITIF